MLLCAGGKSMQDRDIARAKDYWMDYKSGSANGSVPDGRRRP